MRLLEDRVNRAFSIKGIEAIDTLKGRLLRYLQAIAGEGRAVTREVCWAARERPHLSLNACRTLSTFLRPSPNRVGPIQQSSETIYST